MTPPPPHAAAGEGVGEIEGEGEAAAAAAAAAQGEEDAPEDADDNEARTIGIIAPSSGGVMPMRASPIDLYLADGRGNISTSSDRS